ncbi:hypothetical protein [Rhizobium sp.]|uniref:hypothetical protein n=1 Tax=Rhizobium sp. TaxID=391 RepID=UPI0034C5D79B
MYPNLILRMLGISRISRPFLKAFLDRYAQDAKMIEFQATGQWIARRDRPKRLQ